MPYRSLRKQAEYKRRYYSKNKSKVRAYNREYMRKYRKKLAVGKRKKKGRIIKK